MPKAAERWPVPPGEAADRKSPAAPDDAVEETRGPRVRKISRFSVFRDCQPPSRRHNHPPHRNPQPNTHPMSDKSIEERVKDIIVEQLGVNADQVNPEAKFVEDLGADSLDTVELVMAFEEEFEIEVPDEEAEKLTSVGDVINFITSQKG